MNLQPLGDRVVVKLYVRRRYEDSIRNYYSWFGTRKATRRRKLLLLVLVSLMIKVKKLNQTLVKVTRLFTQNMVELK